MSNLEFVKPEKLSLKNHPVLNERWVQDRIAEDPTILGLGDVVLKDRERRQPTAGRLYLLFQHLGTDRRYEVELQLGKTDESHIIRTIEYWDIERKRYPQYDHCAVIVAENITARFLNVISLFNGTIPLIAIQVNALKVGEQGTLVFTKVLDELSLGSEDEDTEPAEIADRTYWENRGSKETVAMVDELFSSIQSFAPGFELKYNKSRNTGWIGSSTSMVCPSATAVKPHKNISTIRTNCTVRAGKGTTLPPSPSRPYSIPQSKPKRVDISATTCRYSQSGISHLDDQKT